MSLTRSAAHVLTITFAFALGTTLVLRADQGRGGGAPPAPAPALVPLTASTLLEFPERYEGMSVTVTAVTVKSLSATTFTVNQHTTVMPPGDLLVIAPTLAEAPPPGAYITLIGEAIAFDPADIAKRLADYKLDLAADLVEKYRGKPAVIATVVLTPDLKDLAKKPLPPATPEENAFDEVMKQVNPAMTALRVGIGASDTATVKKTTATLRKLFGDTKAFFTTRGTIDAIGIAANALKSIDAIDAAATAGKWPDATTASTELGGFCNTCHTAHRVRMDDGTYRVK
jgi:hypothetical protein